MKVNVARNTDSDWDVLIGLWVEEYMGTFESQDESTNYIKRKRFANEMAGKAVPDVKIALAESAKRARRESFDKKLASVGQKAVVTLSKALKDVGAYELTFSDNEETNASDSGKFCATDEIRNWFLHNDALAISPEFAGQVTPISQSGWSSIWANSSHRKLYREGFRFEVDTPVTGCHIIRLVQRPTLELPQVSGEHTLNGDNTSDLVSSQEVKELLKALLAKLA